MKVLGLHIRNANAGDRWSSPLEYFSLGNAAEFLDMREPYDGLPYVVVYGGGSITASPHFRRWPGALTVAWGVGHHIRREPWIDEMRAEHERASALCDLYFPRDLVPGFEGAWTPCASCMHPVFDERHEPVHEVVRYSAARRVSVDDSISPHMTNEDGTIVDAVRFLGSGETVVTSSYHGAYWAGLLGRKVVIEPWGSKFDYVPRLPLAACRDLNRRAHELVMARING